MCRSFRSELILGIPSRSSSLLPLRNHHISEGGPWSPPQAFQDLSAANPAPPTLATMRASSQTAGSLALVLVLVLVLSSSVLASDLPTSCCFSYTTKRIPRTHVIDFYQTNSRCSQPAVVFITRKKYQICANPFEKWVQDHMNYLKVNRTAHATVTY